MKVLPIADCQLPIGVIGQVSNWQSEIENWK